MKHQHVQLASKRNFIRIMALVAMLAVMVCGMILVVNAQDVAASVSFTNDSGITFDSVTNRWVKTYDGKTEIDASKVTVMVGNESVEVLSAAFDNANVADATGITVVYKVGEATKTVILPAAIKPITLSWDGVGTANVTYNPAGTYANVAVSTNANLVGVINGQNVGFNASDVTFVANGLQNTVVFADVTLTGADAANYVVDPLKVNVTVNKIAIDTITWTGLDADYTYGDDLSGIKAVGNGNIAMIVTITTNGNNCTLVATAPNGLYEVTATNATQTITLANQSYDVVLNNGEFLDSDMLNADAGFGYQLVVEGANGATIPASILSQITYKYYDANGNEVAKVTKSGVYTVTATMPTIEGVVFNATTLEATLTVVRNYIVVSTTDGAIVIVGKNGISNSVSATLTIPTEFARKAVRGLEAYRGYALTISGAAAGEKFNVYIPVASDLIADKNCKALTACNLYIYNGSEGTKAVAADTYTVTLSEDGSYYIIEGYVPAGEITLMVAPEYEVPFWGSAIGIALIILIALVLLVVIPIFIGMKLIQLEESGRNPVIAVETEGNVPEVEPVIIPDKIDDPDAVVEEGVDALVEALVEETAAAIEAEADVDATDAVAEAMDELNAEVAEIDLGNADGALDEMTEQIVQELLDQVAAEENEADVSNEVEQAVADAMAAKNYAFASAQIEMVPQNYQKLETEEHIKLMEKLIDIMEEDDDVQNVWHNWEN